MAPSSAFVQSTLTSVQTQNVPWRDNWPRGVKLSQIQLSILSIFSKIMEIFQNFGNSDKQIMSTFDGQW